MRAEKNEKEQGAVIVPSKKTIAKAINVITALRCEKCGTLHDASGDTFVVLLGEIRAGGIDVLITDPGIDDKGHVIAAHVWCRNTECLKPLLDKLIYEYHHIASIDGPRHGPERG